MHYGTRAEFEKKSGREWKSISESFKMEKQRQQGDGKLETVLDQLLQHNPLFQQVENGIHSQATRTFDYGRFETCGRVDIVLTNQVYFKTHRLETLILTYEGSDENDPFKKMLHIKSKWEMFKYDLKPQYWSSGRGDNTQFHTKIIQNTTKYGYAVLNTPNCTVSHTEQNTTNHHQANNIKSTHLVRAVNQIIETFHSGKCKWKSVWLASGGSEVKPIANALEKAGIPLFWNPMVLDDKDETRKKSARTVG